MGRVDFGHALQLLKHGHRVTRQGWNGKGMWLGLHRPTPSERMTQPFIFMRTAQGDFAPWLASQADMLGEDWEVLPDQSGVQMDVRVFVDGERIPRSE